MVVVDSHCHLADEGYSSELPALVERARRAGVTDALCILSADDADEVERVGGIRDAWPGVRFAAGIHPHRSGSYPDLAHEAAERVRTVTASVAAVAVGEIGLDYHYDFAPRAVQRAVFDAQVALAVDLDLPVIIHTREAAEDTAAVLGGFRGKVRGVFHCFTGTADEARTALDLGFYLSFSGIVTFPKAGDLRAIAASVPADRILVETDAPYLAPVPYRGKRNEPAWVVETLGVLARVRETSAEALAHDVMANFARLVGSDRRGDAR